MGTVLPASPRPRTGFFQHLPSGGAIRAASSHIAGLRGDLEFRLHFPEGAASLCPDPGLGVRLWPFPEGARLHGITRLAAPVLLWRKLRAFEALCARIASAIEEEGCERALVHPSMIVAAPPLIGRLGMPAIYYCHEYPRHFYEHGVTKTPNRLTELLVSPLLRRERRLDRENVLAASELVSNSSFMAPRLEAVYGRAPRVVRPAVDSSAFTPFFGPGSGYALSVGAILPLKGHDFTIRSLGRLPVSSRPQLVIVGDRGSGRYAEGLRRLALEMDVDVSIRVSVSFDELRSLYRSASVVVCSQRNEPYGFVPLEAMASGRPVIAVAEGGFIENVRDGETGVLVPREESALAQAVSALLADGARASTLGRAGRRFVEEERNPETEAAQMLEIIRGARRTVA